MSISDYQPPVAELLTYGDCRNDREWRNYVQELGLEAKHIPELIQMATDEDLNFADPESKEVWSPIHAWRALGQLRALDALEPIMRLLLTNREDDWIGIDFPKLCKLMGTETIPTLKKYLADPNYDYYAKADTTAALVTLAKEHPELREDIIATITAELEKFRDNDPTHNGFLISYLMDLKAVEASKTIERAFQSGYVDPFIAGGWNDVQLYMGLISEEEYDRRRAIAEREVASFSAIAPPTAKTETSKGFGSSKSKKKKSRKSSKK